MADTPLAPVPDSTVLKKKVNEFIDLYNVHLKTPSELQEEKQQAKAAKAYEHELQKAANLAEVEAKKVAKAEAKKAAKETKEAFDLKDKEIKTLKKDLAKKEAAIEKLKKESEKLKTQKAHKESSNGADHQDKT